MSDRSETSRLIDRIIATGPARLLQQAGYRKRTRSFSASAGGLFKVVHVQAGRWNTPACAEFTVNLMIVLPFVHEKWTGRAFPRNPASAAPVVSQRIGGLLPGNRDLWWGVTPQSSPDRIASQVSDALVDVGLAFLDRHANVPALLEAARREDARRCMAIHPDLCLAMLLRFQDRTAEATRVVQELVEKNRNGGFADTIRLIARRLELNVDV